MKNIKTVTSALTKALLKTVAGAGTVGLVVIAPNSLQAIEKAIQLSYKGKRINRYKYYAARSGYFNVKQLDDCSYAITLTNKGDLAAKDVLFEDYVIPKPKTWDKKWRVLSFDISEKDRALRDALRGSISRIGMKKIQNSVYVYPYPIDEYIDNIHKRYPEASNHIIQMTAIQIEGQDQLIENFKKDRIL